MKRKKGRMKRGRNEEGKEKKIWGENGNEVGRRRYLKEKGKENEGYRKKKIVRE